jgi:hypothetical protein
MKYTEYGLRITLDELENMLRYAKEQAERNNMEYVIYIKGGEKVKITQYCSYHECDPIDHTYLAK